MSRRFWQTVMADDAVFSDPANPQSWNQYTYALNNPLRYVDPDGHSGDCVAGYDPTTGTCTPAGLDASTLQFFWESAQNFAQQLSAAAQQVAQPVMNRFSGPVGNCVAGSAGVGAAIGGFAGGIIGGAGGGAGGAFGGTLVAPGVGTIGVGAAGAALGYAQGTGAGILAGGAVGGAIGSVLCASSAGGGGGAGGKSQEGLTADQIISQSKRASIREVFPGQHLSKTLAQIRELAARATQRRGRLSSC